MQSRLLAHPDVSRSVHQSKRAAVRERIRAIGRATAGALWKWVGTSKHVLYRVAKDFDRHDYANLAAALAFFFMLSLFPLLILLSSVASFVWNGAAFGEVLNALSHVVPKDAMTVIATVLDDVLGSNLELFSLGMAGALLAASGGFSAMIGALNTAYDVPEGRPYWKKRLVAIWLTLAVGAMTIAALVALVLGPHFGEWLSRWIGASPYFATAWPYLRWSATIAFAIVSVELLYFAAPNVRQRFRAQVPGAIVAIAVWLATSYVLSWYLRNLSNMSKTYGTFGAVVALMLWLYISALAVLIGAELNSELAHSNKAQLPVKERGTLANG
jgi:membrane protein